MVTTQTCLKEILCININFIQIKTYLTKKKLNIFQVSYHLKKYELPILVVIQKIYRSTLSLYLQKSFNFY